MNKSPKNIQNMFNSIAGGYDKLNDVISFGMQKKIKAECVRMLDLEPSTKLLDLCTGTGDFIGLANLKNSVGVDFSEKMLEIAKKKFPKTEFIQADCTDLPFEDNSFDVVTMGYGLRNIQDRKQALSEVYRVLKPQGKFLQLDFGEKNLAGKVFEFATPIFAKIFKTDATAYKYLIDSKRDFPSPKELVKEVETHGFRVKEVKYFVFGAISCQIFVK